jgi:hypothetical protein
MRKGVSAVMSFVDKLQPYVDEWESATHEENVVTEHRLHDGADVGVLDRQTYQGGT